MESFLIYNSLIQLEQNYVISYKKIREKDYDSKIYLKSYFLGKLKHFGSTFINFEDNAMLIL